jgi:hypothetical protein
VPGPLIFISHDSLRRRRGLQQTPVQRDRRHAQDVPVVRQEGSQGFEYGVEWFPELMKTIDAASDVVCLLTENSLERPWILYEAGVAKGKLDVPVHGLAVGVPLSKASTGPFAQFQNCDDDIDSLTKLVSQLVKRLPNADPDVDTVRAQVELFQSRVREILATSSLDATVEHVPDNGRRNLSRLIGGEPGEDGARHQELRERAGGDRTWDPLCP